MKIKMSKILDLRDIYEKIKMQSLPISTTYKISKLFSAINSETEFYQTQLNSIIQEYGQKDENGQFVMTEDKTGVKIDQKDIPIVEQKLQELYNIEVELPDIKFNVKELEKIEISVQEFNYLLPFIED